jgi:acyl-CoA synthetase (AMP-forming)/AMP-acid ligase II
VTEYLDDPKATRRQFRDGWFHPGDSGSVSADGVLSVLGRVDDVANIGGVKIAPDVIEDILRDVPGISDVGVFMSDADGVQRVYAAIVVQGMPDLDDAQRRVIQRMPGGDVPLTFMTVPSIPRNHMGKIERAQLKAHAATAAARAVGPGVH